MENKKSSSLKPEVEESSKLKILIVEDDFASSRILEEYLAEYGDCSTAFDGEEAVETFRDALEQGEPFDAVCLDIMLPKMNGHAVLEKICQCQREYGVEEGVAIIMTTAIDDSGDIKKAFEKGCKAYIVKPITGDKLFGEMRKLSLIKE